VRKRLGLARQAGRKNLPDPVDSGRR